MSTEQTPSNEETKTNFVKDIESSEKNSIHEKIFEFLRIQYKGQYLTKIGSMKDHGVILQKDAVLITNIGKNRHNAFYARISEDANNTYRIAYYAEDRTQRRAVFTHFECEGKNLSSSFMGQMN